MIKLINEGRYLVNGRELKKDLQVDAKEARKGTMAYGIMSKHNLSKDEKKMNLKFDCLMSHDITYVGIIQTARASGLTEFPLPYAMTTAIIHYVR